MQRGEKPAHRHNSHGCCSHALMAGTGHSDLDDLLTNLTGGLRFELELVEVLQPDDYQKEDWAMTMKEKEALVPVLHEEGNRLYKLQHHSEARSKYLQALQYLIDLQSAEKPGCEAYISLHQRKLPFLLNAAQCELQTKDFEAAASHCGMALEIDAENVKAIYRQGVALIGCWQPKRARAVLSRAKELDASLAKAVDRELERLTRLQREHDANDSKRLRNLFASA